VLVKRRYGQETPCPAHTRRRRVAAWLPAIAWAGLIFAFSARPNLRFLSDASLDFVIRKAGHMGAFGILALLLWRAHCGDHRPALTVGLGGGAGGPLRDHG
jgi:hypothetical protein